MSNSPLLWGPNATALNLENQILNANGSLLANNGPLNYLTFGNLENGLTTAYSLGTIGTLTNGLPTGTPTFGSGAAGTLSIAATTSSPLRGTTSLSLVSTAATTAGNMVATQAVTIDAADQAKVLQYKLYYSVPTGAGTANFSGTSANSLAVAVWDVTNSAFLAVAGAFNFIQGTGVGVATGTLQTAINTAQLRFIVYFPAATTAALTVTLDDLFLGPQIAATGPAMTDWQSYTPSFVGFGTPTNVSFQSRRVGDTLQVQGNFTVGTPSAANAQISVGFGGSNANVSIDTTKVSTNSVFNIVGAGGINASNSSFFGIQVLAPSTSGTFVNLGIQTSTTSSVAATTGSNIASAGNVLEAYFQVPIVGWSSNTSQSSDTDTRVVAAVYNGAPATGTVGTAYNPVTFGTKVTDTHGAMSGSLYTVPVSGFYDISATIGIGGTNANSLNNISIYKNGAAIATSANQTASGVGSFYPQVTVDAYPFVAGDTIQIRSYSAAAAPSIIGGADQCYVSISRRSGPAVVSATESVNARYTFVNGGSGIPSATSTTLSSTYATYTKVKDTHSAFNPTTGVYTVPVSGSYHFSLRATVINTAATTGNMQTMLVQSGSMSVSSGTSIPFGAASGGASAQVTDTFNCLAGDTITLQAAQSNGSTLSILNSSAYNSFSVERVGN